MAEYWQQVYFDVSACMTGWTGGDPNRFAAEIDNVTVDPRILEIWATNSNDPFFYWSYYATAATETPGSGSNNEPEFQVRWEDGVWREVAGFRLPEIIGNNFYHGPATPTDLNGEKTSTVSFRWANLNDDIGGIFTPRCFTGFSFWLYATDGLPPTPLGPCRDEEDLLVGTGLQFAYSQHPYFASAPNTSTGQGGIELIDWGEAGPFFNNSYPQLSIDYNFTAADYPLTIGSVQLGVAATGPVDPTLAIEILLYIGVDTNADLQLERLDGTPFPPADPTAFAAAVPDGRARIPLSSLSLVSAGSNGVYAPQPTVPMVSTNLDVPLVLPEPSVIVRTFTLVDLATGLPHLAPTSNIVLGTQFAGGSFFTYTTDGVTGTTTAWAEIVPAYGGALPILRNPHFKLCFGTTIPLTAHGCSCVQFVG